MKNYYFLFVVAILGSANLKATIQYTDLNPDSTKSVTSGGYLDIDVDGDNSSDFTFALNGFGSSMFSVSISTFNDIITDNLASNPNSCYATAIFGGMPINQANRWADYTRNIRLDDQNKKNFAGNGEMFIGFRLENNGDYNYGWMLVELTAGLELQIKAFAYEDTPNTPIVVGDTGNKIISLSENKETTVEIYPSIVSENLNVNSTSLVKEVKVFSLAGTLVYSKSPNASEVELNLAHLNNGYYIIQVVNINGESYTQKFVRKD